MIHKSAEYKNGYIFSPTSTNEDFQKIIKEYNAKGTPVRTIILNEYTVANFGIKKPFTMNAFASDIGITINNKIADGVFFINHTF